MICPKCGGYYTVRDSPNHWSSIMCKCMILIYYYDGYYTVEIPKKDYVRKLRDEIRQEKSN